MEPRAIGSPLSVGSPARQQPLGPHGNGSRIHSAALLSQAPAASAPATPRRPLPGASSPSDSSGMQKAVNAFRTILPIAQKVLPLLDGNLGTAIVNLLAPRPVSRAAPPPLKVDLSPIEDGLVQLQSQHLAMRDQLREQNSSLRRVEDQLEAVREATDRNTREQQELLEDLNAFRKKIWLGAAVGIGLLTAGFVLELLMFLHLRHVPL